MRYSQPLINWTLKTNTSIRKRKKTKILKRNVDQKAKIRPMCRKLYYKYQGFVWILDDMNLILFELIAKAVQFFRYKITLKIK